jgi:3-hydroxyisobutyrate dehydrogenase
MAEIAFLGMGAMGSRMALNLINAGHKLCAWNRDISRTAALRDTGATVATTPRQATANADFVIAMLRDNEASETVWCDPDSGALWGMKPEAVAIDCSTLAVRWVRELHKRCVDKNIAFLDAPVAGSLPQAETSQLIFFVGGDATVFARAKPILAVMGAVVHHAGAGGDGAAIKLAVNALLGIQLATLAELINFLKANGLDAKHAVDIVTGTPACSPAAKNAAATMLAENFTPRFPVQLVEKDLSYAITNAENHEQPMPMTQAARQVFQLALNEGFGEDDMVGVVKLYS